MKAVQPGEKRIERTWRIAAERVEKELGLERLVRTDRPPARIRILYENTVGQLSYSDLEVIWIGGPNSLRVLQLSPHHADEICKAHKAGRKMQLFLDSVPAEENRKF